MQKRERRHEQEVAHVMTKDTCLRMERSRISYVFLTRVYPCALLVRDSIWNATSRDLVRLVWR